MIRGQVPPFFCRLIVCILATETYCPNAEKRHSKAIDNKPTAVVTNPPSDISYTPFFHHPVCQHPVSPSTGREERREEKRREEERRGEKRREEKRREEKRREKKKKEKRRKEK